MFHDLLADTQTGHNIVGTVFVDCHSMYRKEGPAELRCIGETEFANGVAAMSASGHLRQPARLRRHRQPCRPAPGSEGGRGVRRPDRRRQRPLQGHPLPDRLGRRSRHPQLAHRSDAGADPRQDLARGLQGARQARPDLRCLALPSAARRDRRAGRRLSRHPDHPRPCRRPAGLCRLCRPARRGARGLEEVDGRARQAARTSPSRSAASAWRWAGSTSTSGRRRPARRKLADAFKPWVETCIELFGADRCMFESNFPVDKITSRLRRAVECLQAARRQGIGGGEDGPVLGHGGPRLQARSAERSPGARPRLWSSSWGTKSCVVSCLPRSPRSPLLFVAPFASAQTFKVVMHSDVKVLDPIWSGAYITRNHGYMLYDTLFAIDEKLQIKPQMVDKWEQSADGLTWTFTLRDGLEWHDGTPVTAEDCIASLKRWSARDSMGQKLAPVAAGVQGRRRQDLPDRAQGEVRSVARGDRQAVGRRALHDAQARRRDRSVQADRRRDRLGPVHAQEGRVEARREDGLRQEPEVQAAGRADVGPGGRQGGQARPRRMGVDPRSRDADQRADQRRDRHDRDASTTTICRSLEKDQGRAGSSRAGRPTSTCSA